MCRDYREARTEDERGDGKQEEVRDGIWLEEGYVHLPRWALAQPQATERLNTAAAPLLRSTRAREALPPLFRARCSARCCEASHAFLAWLKTAAPRPRRDLTSPAARARSSPALCMTHIIEPMSIQPAPLVATKKKSQGSWGRVVEGRGG